MGPCMCSAVGAAGVSIDGMSSSNLIESGIGSGEPQELKARAMGRNRRKHPERITALK
jgi:hypothetical protein